MPKASSRPTASAARSRSRVRRPADRVRRRSAGVTLVVADHVPPADRELPAQPAVPPEHRGRTAVDQQDGRIGGITERLRTDLRAVDRIQRLGSHVSDRRSRTPSRKAIVSDDLDRPWRSPRRPAARRERRGPPSAQLTVSTITIADTPRPPAGDPRSHLSVMACGSARRRKQTPTEPTGAPVDPRSALRSAHVREGQLDHRFIDRPTITRPDLRAVGELVGRHPIDQRPHQHLPPLRQL